MSMDLIGQMLSSISATGRAGTGVDGRPVPPHGRISATAKAGQFTVSPGVDLVVPTPGKVLATGAGADIGLPGVFNLSTRLGLGQSPNGRTSVTGGRVGVTVPFMGDFSLPGRKRDTRPVLVQR